MLPGSPRSFVSALRASPSRPLPREQRDAEHAERERGDGEARLQRVVLEHHLEIDRQRDHRAAESDLLEQLLRDPKSEVLGLEQIGVQKGRLPSTLPPREPEGQRRQAEEPRRERPRGALRFARLDLAAFINDEPRILAGAADQWRTGQWLSAVPYPGSQGVRYGAATFWFFGVVSWLWGEHPRSAILALCAVPFGLISRLLLLRARTGLVVLL